MGQDVPVGEPVDASVAGRRAARRRGRAPTPTGVVKLRLGAGRTDARHRRRQRAWARRSATCSRCRTTTGRDWCGENAPYDGLATRTGVPEQSWLLPNGTEVLTTRADHRPRRGGPVDAGRGVLRSGRGRARLDRERSDLVATVAHELRSPLTGVKGFVQAMLNRWDQLTDEQKKLMLTTVHADSDRLSRLIAELLDVARIDTGRLSLHPRPCDAGAAGRPGRRLGPRPAPPARSSSTPADDLPQIARRPRQVHPGRHQPRRERRPPRRRRGPVSACAALDADAEHPGHPAHRRGRGRRHPRGDAAPGVHQVLDRRRPRRLRARACTSSTASSAPTAARVTHRATPTPAAEPGSSVDLARGDRAIRAAISTEPSRVVPASGDAALLRSTHDRDARVLVVEDERVINDAVADRLRAEGYDVDPGLRRARRGRPVLAERPGRSSSST